MRYYAAQAISVVVYYQYHGATFCTLLDEVCCVVSTAAVKFGSLRHGEYVSCPEESVGQLRGLWVVGGLGLTVVARKGCRSIENSRPTQVIGCRVCGLSVACRVAMRCSVVVLHLCVCVCV